MAGENNPYYVAPVNPMQALMAGQEGYKEVSGAIQESQKKQVREQAAQEIMQGGNPQNALAWLLSVGDDKGAATLATVIHNKQTSEYQNKSLAETSRFHTGSLANQAANTAETARFHSGTLANQNATLAETRRQHDLTADKPMVVGQNLVDRTGKIVFQGSSTMSDGAKEITARQLINGDTSGLTNIGKGAQGNETLAAIRNKAAEILMAENGMSPTEAAAHLGTKLQAFKASSIGQSAEARTGATREANLNIILKATEAAIPAALEASDNVERIAGKFVPLNQIIQKGQVMTSDVNLRKFGMANLQLAEHWARAMNPTGVMRESDRDMALGFLSTADSKPTYKAVVEQLRTQITRERDAIKAGTSHGAPNAASPAAAPSAAPNMPPPPPGTFLVK